ncbi:nuclear transport factor 2 family protein [Streptantibioticus parmotrematis]|uniref:nuclear transport factor 2 family protein n=1 Tax=Streptantibioticus parmotrematis TaxID=2873249 RepID=UPI0033DB69C2
MKPRDTHGTNPADVDVVLACLAGYRAQDRAAVERLIADDFVFTSPQDDHIGKDAFFRRCFPTADRFVEQRVLHAVPAGPGTVFLAYEYVLRDGERYRNVELSTVRDGRITETQVYFGGRFS